MAQNNLHIGLDLVTRLLICKPPPHCCTRNLLSSRVCEGIGAYKVLSGVLPHCSQLVDPLKSSLANLQSHDHVQYDDNPVRNSPQHKMPFTRTSLSSSLVPLTSFGLWLMAQSPDAVLELPCTLPAKTAFSLPAWLPLWSGEGRFRWKILVEENIG